MRLRCGVVDASDDMGCVMDNIKHEVPTTRAIYLANHGQDGGWMTSVPMCLPAECAQLETGNLATYFDEGLVNSSNGIHVLVTVPVESSPAMGEYLAMDVIEHTTDEREMERHNHAQINDGVGWLSSFMSSFTKGYASVGARMVQVFKKGKGLLQDLPWLVLLEMFGCLVVALLPTFIAWCAFKTLGFEISTKTTLNFVVIQGLLAMVLCPMYNGVQPNQDRKIPEDFIHTCFGIAAMSAYLSLKLLWMFQPLHFSLHLNHFIIHTSEHILSSSQKPHLSYDRVKTSPRKASGASALGEPEIFLIKEDGEPLEVRMTLQHLNSDLKDRMQLKVPAVCTSHRANGGDCRLTYQRWPSSLPVSKHRADMIHDCVQDEVKSSEHPIVVRVKNKWDKGLCRVRNRSNGAEITVHSDMTSHTPTIVLSL